MKRVLTPMKAIRAKCMDCTCHQPKEIRVCRITSCALWPYRMGKRPKQGDGMADALEREAVEVAG